jgi:hypothetical protein
MGEDMGYDQDSVVGPGFAPKAGRADAKPGDGGDYAKNNLIQIPSINLPKGGGALRSIDEKFQANPVNGTASLTIPIPLSPSRGAFGPRHSLLYNSGSGNSEFGLGWSIDLPTIHRRTDKFLPRYFDAEDSDVFQFTGIEDMVRDLAGPSFSDGNTIQRYMPRIEGGFTLIEKITTPTGNVFWKTTTRENLVVFFGLTSQAQLADPAVSSGRIFKWLPELSYDDKGNCIQYEYAAENLQNVPLPCMRGTVC